MKEIILLKSGEIALKGLNRSTFEDIMAKNARRRLQPLGEFKIWHAQSTTYVQPLTEGVDMDEAVRRLQTVFGIVAVTKSCVVEKDFSGICPAAAEYFAEQLTAARTFKVEAKRSDKAFPMKSPEISRELGGYLLSRFHHLKVKVEQPEITITVEIREQGAYTGRTVAGHLCFAPDEAIGRGEFLIMAMHLLDSAPEEAALTSGFADETDTPQWMRPYIVSALRSGVVSGAATEAGVFFRPSDALTHAEAAVMVQGLMKLPQPDTQAVFSQETEQTVPAWAQDAVAALTAAGFTVELAAAESPMTRLEAAQLLYQVCAFRQAESEKQAQ